MFSFPVISCSKKLSSCKNTAKIDNNCNYRQVQVLIDITKAYMYVHVHVHFLVDSTCEQATAVHVCTLHCTHMHEYMVQYLRE